MIKKYILLIVVIGLMSLAGASDFNLFVCKYPGCENNVLVFAVGEPVVFNYFSTIRYISIDAKVTSPGNLVSKVILPSSASFDKTGAYNLDVSVLLKDGRKISETKIFFIIEKHPEIQSVSECNGDGICDSNETIRNCPQDCLIDKNSSWLWIIIFIGTVVALIILIIILILAIIKLKSSKT